MATAARASVGMVPPIRSLIAWSVNKSAKSLVSGLASCLVLGPGSTSSGRVLVRMVAVISAEVAFFAGPAPGLSFAV